MSLIFQRTSVQVFSLKDILLCNNLSIQSLERPKWSQSQSEPLKKSLVFLLTKRHRTYFQLGNRGTINFVILGDCSLHYIAAIGDSFDKQKTNWKYHPMWYPASLQHRIDIVTRRQCRYLVTISCRYWFNVIYIFAMSWRCRPIIKISIIHRYVSNLSCMPELRTISQRLSVLPGINN